MSEIVAFGGETKLDIPVNRVLDGAAAADLGVVFVLGREPSGDLYAASSSGDTGVVLMLMEEFKHKLLSGEYK